MLLGLGIFIDDYLNALTVGSSMKKVTDKFKVPREMLKYIVDSTAAPLCVLIIGAVISAGAFGSHACFYGDATVLSASATGCNNMAHVMTQLPYALLAGVISVFIYLGLGVVM